MGTDDDFLVANSAEATQDLQDRVARLARAIFWFAAVMGGVSLGTHLLTEGHVAEVGGIGHEALHFIVPLPATLVWWRCRGDSLSPGRVGALDTALTLSTCALYALMGFSASASLSVELSVILALSYTLVWRSILVPSSLHRTLWISAAAAVPTIALLLTQGVPSAFRESPESGHVFVGFLLLWCLIAVFSSAINSRQLFGLRVAIREMGKLGQYTLEEKIGEGGMGVVYRATHAMLRRPAAIKLLSKKRRSDKDRARFEHEVQLTTRLRHPNTVSIFDYGLTADGVCYYVMEYLDGLDLERLVREHGPIPSPRAIHILSQICAALAEAHALELIHRDIKPANVVLIARVDEPDVVKVVDFGLARALDKRADESALGVITGTPLYLAPEAITAPETADARADIYALGAVAYFLVSGRNVFEGSTVVEVLGRHVLEEPKPPSTYLATPLAADLEAVILRCLAKDRAARPASAALMRAELDHCEDAERYDRAAGLAWWRARERRATPEGSASASPATMAIDLRSRNELHATSLGRR